MSDDRPRLDTRPANCRCGAGDLASCLCGTTAGDWAKADRFRDSLGVSVRVGDTIMINGWGGDVRQEDVRNFGTVTGFARTRLIVDWDRKFNAPMANIDPRFVGVLSRVDGKGFEGNR